jgi:hypothetical protein
MHLSSLAELLVGGRRAYLLIFWVERLSETQRDGTRKIKIWPQ